MQIVTWNPLITKNKTQNLIEMKCLQISSEDLQDFIASYYAPSREVLEIEYEKGYDVGHDEGYEAGYDEGSSDCDCDCDDC